jgi:transposase
VGWLLACGGAANGCSARVRCRPAPDHIDDARLDDLYRIGVDEISYKRGHEFLTIVADHDTGNVVWVGKQRSKAAFEEFITALGPERAAAIEAISLDGSSVYRAWELKEQLRDLYRTVEPADARAYLKRWCTSAKRSRIPAFTNLVRRIQKHFEAIIAAVELGLSNSRLEGINAKMRLIQRRGFGYRNLDALTAMSYLVLGGVAVQLPTET